ncbi:MAG: SRPBCC family protein [Burkholderiaceae bacterium]|jgi:carbon monoxide dehydrogenase subunit G
MEVQLEKRYPLDVDPARAWSILKDVPTVAGFMPGAELTEKIDESHYRGTVKVKVGPASAAFGGEITVVSIDDGARELHLLGKGADRGGSTASLDLVATIEDAQAPSASVLLGKATMTVNGKFAQFGGRMMGQVSDVLLAQFVENFRARAIALAPVAEATPGQATAIDTAGTGEASPDRAASVIKPQPINAFGLVWKLIKNWFAGMIGRSA